MYRWALVLLLLFIALSVKAETFVGSTTFTVAAYHTAAGDITYSVLSEGDTLPPDSIYAMRYNDVAFFDNIYHLQMTLTDSAGKSCTVDEFLVLDTTPPSGRKLVTQPLSISLTFY